MARMELHITLITLLSIFHGSNQHNNRSSPTWLRIRASRLDVRPACYRHQCIKEKLTLTCRESSVEHVFSWPPYSASFEIPIIPSDDYLNVSLAVVGTDPSFNILRTCDYANFQCVETARNNNSSSPRPTVTLNFSSSCFDATLKIDWIDRSALLATGNYRLTKIDRRSYGNETDRLASTDHSVVWIVIALIATSLILLIIVVAVVRYYRRDDNNSTTKNYRSADAIKQNLYHIKTNNKYCYNTNDIREIRATTTTGGAASVSVNGFAL